MHWGRKYRYQSFLKNGGGITLVLGAAFAALESDGSVDGSDETTESSTVLRSCLTLR